VLDGDSGDVVGTVKFGEGKLEGIGFDGRGNGYVNAEDKSAVFVFDLKTLTPKAKWSSAPGEGGTGLVVDGPHHRVISACGNGQLVVFDSDSGKVVATPAIDEDPDGLAFDSASGRLFVPCVGGTLNILQQETPDKYTALQTVTTQPGCRTIALDGKKSRVMTASPKFGPKPAPVPGGPKPRPPALPDTFEVLVVGAE
jgi:sugar lactone lactonase YvrE